MIPGSCWEWVCEGEPSSATWWDWSRLTGCYLELAPQAEWTCQDRQENWRGRRQLPWQQEGERRERKREREREEGWVYSLYSIVTKIKSLCSSGEVCDQLSRYLLCIFSDVRYLQCQVERESKSQREIVKTEKVSLWYLQSGITNPPPYRKLTINGRQ